MVAAADVKQEAVVMVKSVIKASVVLLIVPEQLAVPLMDAGTIARQEPVLSD